MMTIKMLMAPILVCCFAAACTPAETGSAETGAAASEVDSSAAVDDEEQGKSRGVGN